MHAINEIIERDAISLLLIGQFLHQGPAPLRVVEPATLPPALTALHARAEARIGRPVSLLEMTTDLDVPLAMEADGIETDSASSVTSRPACVGAAPPSQPVTPLNGR